MATQFQNRLVGTLILVSLGIIFIPDVFDGKKAHYQENFEAIPLHEEFDESVLNEPVEKPETSESFMPQDPVMVTVTNDDAEVSEPIEADTQAPKEGYQDSAWVIRLGTFRNLDNAKNLVATLRSKGYPAQLLPRDVKEGELARVEVGPDVSKDKLASMTADLESLTGLKGQLLRFNPLNP
ncbi:SPOR domain-containing protein [Enterovibrio sp. ZSDZ35]|uniref:SPOR domain-containing protein n=1 Tax=Enterovibrio qingdaonensis TaxID=2899818 RepID=A0ABT5QNE9_9GAMM|nr:SPOR domain-containing protein [Enterovibrio sp. ZSDZ35]MDD1782499.1 SPOR domain-containing protein [Enterovibrio sp. ZSDZ35]